MSVPEETIGPKTGSASGLSVDAAVFVPGTFNKGSFPSQVSVFAGKDQHRGVNRPGQLVEVPQYITSCYPFVSSSNATRHRPWSGPSPVARPHSPRYPPGFHGEITRAPFPVPQITPPTLHFPSHPPHQWYSSAPPTAYTPSYVIGPVTAGVHVPFDGGTPHLGDGLLPTPSFPPVTIPGTPKIIASNLVGSEGLSCVPPGMRTVFPPDAKMNLGRNVDGFVSMQQSSGAAVRGWQVSTGTQNEALGLASRPHRKTIILRDSSIQTDFNKEIADQTLAEKPNALFHRGQKKNKGSQPQLSTDSEEVDSDSGYSSPLHRRNAMSNGTHPFPISNLVHSPELSKNGYGGDSNVARVGVNCSASCPHAGVSIARGGSIKVDATPVNTGSKSVDAAASAHAGTSRAYSDVEGTLLHVPAKHHKSQKSLSTAGSVDTSASAIAGTVKSNIGISTNTSVQGTAAAYQTAKNVCSSGTAVSASGSGRQSNINSSSEKWVTVGKKKFLTDSHRDVPMKRNSIPRSAAVVSVQDNSKMAVDTSPISEEFKESLSKDVREEEPKDDAKCSSLTAESRSVTEESTEGGDPTKSVTKQSSKNAKDATVAIASRPSPEFPRLTPAKRNEPPWSLTPYQTKLKAADEACTSVQSYAAIVKNISTPFSASSTVSAMSKTSVSNQVASSPSKQQCDTRDVEGGKGNRALASPESRNRTSLHPVNLLSEDDNKAGEEGKKKKRPKKRQRRRTKGTEEGISDGLSGMERTISSSNISPASEGMLHFEDEAEYTETHIAVRAKDSSPYLIEVSPLSYSDVVKMNTVKAAPSNIQSAPESCLSEEDGLEDNSNSQPGQGSFGLCLENKRYRKRRKRRELADRAAEAEVAEISLEQQMLRELGHKSGRIESRPSSVPREGKSPSRGLITDPNVIRQSRQGQNQGRRSHQPIALNIAEMLDAFEKKKALSHQTVVKEKSMPHGDAVKQHNLLDSSAPSSKRGKEREVPKTKKPSPLKKVILKEREEKKRMRLINDCSIDVDVDLDVNDGPIDPLEGVDLDSSGNPVGLAESDLSQDGLSSHSVETDQGVSPGADLSPISQTSPLSMSPLTPGASPISSPIAGYLGRDPVVLRIHSRRFREYCTQILDKDIDTCCTSLLHELVRFQDRMYHKDPVKAKSKRRIVLGLREVTKHLKLKKIKCVIISPNLEKIQSKGGLDEALNNILNMCQEQNVPFVFALGRRALGRACAKLVPVSVAGIFNYEGCEDKFNQLISLTHKGREAYKEMVLAVEQEISENPPPSVMSVGSSVPSIYAHMGHSRTPSGCSAISFTSSILSEPISENYPHAEPETDSKGYEIVRDSSNGSAVPSPASNTFHDSPGMASFKSSVDEIDDGNEADTEDFSYHPRRKRNGSIVSSKCSDKFALSSGNVNNNMDINKRETEDDNNVTGADSEDEEDEALNDLPPIDSIHSSMYELSTEILSQHSSRTIDNSEVLSTHSSKTLGESNLNLVATDRAKQDGSRTPESGGGGRSRLIDKDRIQNWVETTQLCLEEENDSSSRDGEGSLVEEVEEDYVEAEDDKVTDVKTTDPII